ncbi:hypothetical protein CCZ20_26340 [Priestia aryabhattai]|uniref:hypothetical protein n=1 Tax=Priestia aryabhattai TaxID=412384 RepID=UPI000B50DBE9|nr:hypothetical protein [Priestia aryabhattai]OVE34465.1 hypothetical protein CCZ20_26340 [Priestia aryabhattai]
MINELIEKTNEFGVIEEFEILEKSLISKGDQVYIKTDLISRNSQRIKGIILTVTDVKISNKFIVIVEHKNERYRLNYCDLELVKPTGVYIIKGKRYVKSYRSPKRSDLFIVTRDLIKNKKRNMKIGEVLKVNKVVYRGEFVKTPTNELYHKSEFILLDYEEVQDNRIEFIFECEKESNMYSQTNKMKKEVSNLKREKNQLYKEVRKLREIKQFLLKETY